ncbi:hypothetical protein [Alkaliphilus hydrothermalis]|uniref:Uncharacterized protein n=1 Tax=Alkaliphilus hydrothermalis TaxID=1482730 RepID=A0ABS2NLJ3_9FIRM|nr:hypothetical protein [Alkaliphilus hydrothermalis]MBM7613807.1 hypothetical protein [Alkaliphilus hydrothermalis]
MRKVWLIILMFLLSVQHVLAADLIYRITHNDQDALVLGEIVQGIGNSYKIDVIHVISGRLPQKTITLHTDF